MLTRKHLWSFVWLLTPFFLVTISSYFFTHIVYDDLVFYTGLFFLSGLGCIFGLSVFLTGRSRNRLLFIIRLLLLFSILGVFIASGVQVYRNGVDTYAYVTKKTSVVYGIFTAEPSSEKTSQFSLETVGNKKESSLYSFSVPSSMNLTKDVYDHQYVKVHYLPFNHQLTSVHIVKEKVKNIKDK